MSHSIPPRSAALPTAPEPLVGVQELGAPGTTPLSRGAPRPENLRQIDLLKARFEDFRDYARTFLGHSVSSVTWYQYPFRSFCQFLLESAHLPPAQFDIRMYEIGEWIRWSARRGIRPITLNSYYRALRAFFNDREKRDGVTNPFHGRPAPAVGEHVPKAKSTVECQRILTTAANYPWPTEFQRDLAVAVIGVMLYAGLRRSEVTRLERLDVQLDAGTIRIRDGKGRHGGKSRMAYIAPDLDVLLRNYLRARDRARVIEPEFFVSEAKHRPLGIMPIRTLLKKVSIASGIPFSAHVLRHSFVTQLLRSGVPIHVARDLAGHSSIETTMGYLRVFDEDRQAGIRKVRFR